MSHFSPPEFNHFVSLPTGKKTYKFEANVHECAEIARAYEVLGVKSFSVTIEITPRKHLWVVGKVTASLIQECVATFEPIDVVVNETFKAIYTTNKNFEKEIELDLEGKEPAEFLPADNGEIDLCLIALEFFALGLNPYPRKEGI